MPMKSFQLYNYIQIKTTSYEYLMPSLSNSKLLIQHNLRDYEKITKFYYNNTKHKHTLMKKCINKNWKIFH